MYYKPRFWRTAFTLTEVLIVFSIIGILAMLLLPAVNAVREACRKVQCANNIRQLSLAAHNHLGAHGVYPPGRFLGEYGTGPESRAWSWLAISLPYLEEITLYDEGRIPHATLSQSKNTVPRPVAVFLCPSAAGDLTVPRIDAGDLSGFPVGNTTYKAVSGANWGEDKSLNLKDIGSAFRNRGWNGSYDGLNEPDGIMWRSDIKHRIGQKDVVDGTSKTFLIGEDVPRHNAWVSWPYANNAYGTCAIPPNIIPRDPMEPFKESFSFRSDHPGGLFFAMADGSVHFVAESIDLAVYRALATRNGKENIDEF
jgi:prepilin-type N-terminal cleavage/methylation domain-containing protein